jgi:hypothetical protein
MRTQPGFVEELEGRTLLSVSIGLVGVTPVAAHPPPRIVARGERVRLSAQDVTTTPFDGVRSVTYFIDTDGDGSFSAADVLIGRARNPDNHFAVTGFLKRSAAGGGAVTVSAVAQGLTDPADFGPAATQAITLPPAPATAKSGSPPGATGQSAKVGQAARRMAAQADAEELVSRAFAQESADFSGGTSLPANDAGVLGAGNG